MRASNLGLTGLAAALLLSACGEPPAPPPPRPTVKTAAPVLDDSDKSATAASIYVYSPVGKRDPFENVFSVKEVTPVKVPGGKPTPLQRWSLDKLRLVLTVTGTASPIAMVEDPDGRGWTVHIGSFIGTSWGKVSSIQRDSINVTQTITDHATGRVYPETVTVKVPETETELKAEQQLRDGESLGAAQQSQGN